MSRLRLVLRSLTFYRRTHAAVVCGVAVATAVLVGALAVGDSVRYSLSRAASLRLGRTSLAMAPPERFFREQLADDLQTKLASPAAPIISLGGTAYSNRTKHRANMIRVIGVDRRFWSFGDGGDPFPTGEDAVVVNAKLAGKLGCRPGDRILVRVEKPGIVPREAPLSLVDDAHTGSLLSVAAVAPDEQMGRFSLQANQIPPGNAFVPLQLLQKLLDMEGKANVLLLGRQVSGHRKSPAAVESELRASLDLADIGLELRELPGSGFIELRSDRVFLPQPVIEAAADVAPGAIGILTYFVNEIRNGPRSTPYSMVSAVGPLTANSRLPDPLPEHMARRQIAVNQWLGEDLRASAGNRIELKYFTLGPMRRLIERSSSFELARVLPMTGLATDKQLMPELPGLSVAEDCADWEPGIPIDLDRIRRKDELYWDEFRGAPKAFISLADGRDLWSNRFGSLTAIRYPSAGQTKEQLAAGIVKRLDPASLGLFFLPVADQARRASLQTTDFGQLFLALSVFLIVAALLLTALMAALGIDQRSWEVGALLALGFRPVVVKGLLMSEHLLLTLMGSVIGVPAGLVYTKLVLAGLRTVWSGAVAGSSLHYNADISTVVLAAIASLAISWGAMWLVLRRRVSGKVSRLLNQQPGVPMVATPSPLRRRLILSGCLVFAVTAVGFAMAGSVSKDLSVAGFFAAGASLLLAGVLAGWLVLSLLLPSRSGQLISKTTLAVRNTARRAGRSLSVVSILACGAFLITAVAANRRDPTVQALDPNSGTGGFSLVGRTSLPVFQDLNDPAEKARLGLDRASLRETRFVPMRLRQADDASCLNLNRAQIPSIHAVPPDDLKGRFSFVQSLSHSSGVEGWQLLTQDFGPGVVAAVADHATVVWGLNKALGDELDYLDDRGKTFRIRIVAVLADSLFQGKLLISNENFKRRFGSTTGFAEFLIDTPARQSEAAATELAETMQAFGMDVTPSGEILAGFLEVQNTYLAIFQTLGALGMALGSVGLGLVVARNVLERRSELALMRAVGFPKSSLVSLTFLEHAGLLASGLALGAISALVAVTPALMSPGSDVSFGWLVAVLVIVFASGGLWTYLAAILALRGPMLARLRNE